MKICIFDQYFSTLGGGERHIGVIAQLLLRKHKVYLIHCGSFQNEDILKKLNLDLSGIIFIDIMTGENINQKVEELVKSISADLFINATHFSQLYIKSIRNISLVFFPKFIYPWAISKKEHFKYKIGKILFKEYDSKIKFEQFSFAEHIEEGYGMWSSARSIIHINSSFNKVSIYYKNLKNVVVKDVIRSIKLHGKLNFYFDKNRFYFNYLEQNPSKLELDFNTFIPADIEPGNLDKRSLGIFITQVYIDTFSWLTKIILVLWRTRKTKNIISRLYVKSNCIGEQLDYKNFLKQNEIIISNSTYTTNWINRLYGKEIKPQIIYPAMSSVNMLYSKEEKKNYIISVGRFFTGDHSKKQLEMIKFFKSLYDTVPQARNYTYHICGGTHKEERNQNYLKLCYRAAEGYPIIIHPDINFNDLRELYAESKFFWHAAGLYENEEQSPEKFEHLGFTTIEAMTAGCVPVVIGIAGQLEVVKNNINGFLWKTPEDLISKTQLLMQDDTLRKKLSAAAMLRSEDFNYKHFENSVVTTFEKVGIEI